MKKSTLVLLVLIAAVSQVAHAATLSGSLEGVTTQKGQFGNSCNTTVTYELKGNILTVEKRHSREKPQMCPFSVRGVNTYVVRVLHTMKSIAYVGTSEELPDTRVTLTVSQLMDGRISLQEDLGAFTVEAQSN